MTAPYEFLWKDVPSDDELSNNTASLRVNENGNPGGVQARAAARGHPRIRPAAALLHSTAR